MWSKTDDIVPRFLYEDHDAHMVLLAADEANGDTATRQRPVCDAREQRLPVPRCQGIRNRSLDTTGLSNSSDFH